VHVAKGNRHCRFAIAMFLWMRLAVLIVPLDALPQQINPWIMPIHNTTENDVSQQGEGTLTVLVQDYSPNGGRIGGIEVNFSAPDPSSGPSILFSNGLRSITVVTTADGFAVARFRPNTRVGSFQIEVQVTYRGQRAFAQINQINFAPPKSHLKKYLLIGIVAAAGTAAGVAAANGKTNNGTNTGPSGTVANPVPGSPTVGPPQ
jgi:hypothetical protein